MRILLHISIYFCFILIFAPTAMASDPKLMGTFGDWSAYSFTENGNKVCYMTSQPKTAVGNYTKRGDIFALITHRPAEGTKNVFSYMTGYSYKPDSSVSVKIDGTNYNLFTQGDTAWTADAAADNSITNAIKTGTNMVVVGTSSRGTVTTDNYSLSGSTKAYQTISQECGV